MKRTTAALIALVGILLAGLCEVEANQQDLSDNTIVPGVRVGAFTLGMSKDDVLKKLGKPELIYWGRNNYTLDNLPLRYRMNYRNIQFEIDDLLNSQFDDRTVWPAPKRIPSGFDWQKIMEQGKNPGLGVRSLHKKGITGRGVRIAILDWTLLVDHQEFADCLQLYEEVHIPIGQRTGMHGSAVASIAVGKTAGVAPGAELFYIAPQHYLDREEGGGITLRYWADDELWAGHTSAPEGYIWAPSDSRTTARGASMNTSFSPTAA